MKKIKVTLGHDRKEGEIFRESTFFLKMTDRQYEAIEQAMEITGESFDAFISHWVYNSLKSIDGELNG